MKFAVLTLVLLELEQEQVPANFEHLAPQELAGRELAGRDDIAYPEFRGFCRSNTVRSSGSLVRIGLPNRIAPPLPAYLSL